MSAVHLLEERRTAIIESMRSYGVVRAWIIGSALSDAWDPQSSDFDFVVEFGSETARRSPLDELVTFPEELGSILGHRTDVINWTATKNPFLRREIERTRQEFFGT